MTTKTPTPRLASSDKLLSSNILLPKDALISCFIYTPLAGPSSHSRAYNDVLEMARRDVISRNQNNGPATLIRSILTSVHIRGGDSCMYAFLIGKKGQAAAELSALHFDGLMVTSQISFAPSDIYPCSSSCSELETPCSACLTPSALTPQQHLPRQSLRVVYSHFLEAVRLRLIADISDASNTKQSGCRRLAKRLKGGFLLGPPPSSTEWSKGWDTHASSRPLIFCQLQIHLLPSPQPQLIIHPQLHTTPFVVLPHGPGRPLSEGAPITLLPHGTPAFYLASYSGPTSALRRQFHDSLRGMGVSGWDAEEGTEDQWFSSKNHAERAETKFIIAWISVENKQGEDKGITIIYPSSLCLSFVPSATSAPSWAGRREPLAYIPELPAQLQPSPQVTAAVPATSSFFPPTVPSHLHGPIRPSSCPATPSPHALRAFRTLTLSRSRGIRHVAAEVNGYVDAVAREREKERERLRRERERDGGSPRLVRANTSGQSSATPVATPAPAPPPTPQSASIAAPPPLPQPVAGPSQQTNQAPSTFYPSPPQTNPPFAAPLTEDRTSPEVADPPPVPVVPTPMILPPPVVPQTQSQIPPPQSYDPFDSQSYMDIDMAMNDFGGMGGMIDMGGMGMNFGMGGSGDDRQRGASAMDFDTDFTDDDFSFFDRAPDVAPPVPLRMHNPPPVAMLPEPHPGGGLTPAAGPAPLGLGIGGMMDMSPPLFGESPLAHTLQGDWPGGVFTPGPDMHHMMTLPDLLPPSPGDTPNSQIASAPATPSVQLAEEDHALVRRASSIGLSFGIFNPIPFAHSHRVADGKYAMGKFALPSPPPESDDEFNFDTNSRSGGTATQTQENWRFKYASKTDPRIGVVRKLIGVKRKTSTSEDPGRKMSPSWVREHEDWENRQAAAEEDARSEPESDDDDGEEEDSPLVSRPSTPPPAYLPLGPTLLHTHFQHPYLLPLSTPLRPPGAAVAPTNITTLTVASASVPTPVSPAATLGAASEKSKSLEAAAFAVGKEVVENSVWAEAWRTTVISMGSKQSPSRDAVWPADVKTIAQWLRLVPDLEGPLDMETLFDLDPAPSPTPSKSNRVVPKSVQTLEAPMISIGKADAVIQVLPTALRFWEKLGLSPRGGKKDATVFVLFEDDGDARQQLVEAWLAKITTIYNSKHFGTLTPGTHNLCSRDGIFSLRFDSTFRKSLAAFVSSLTPQASMVFYVVTPVSTMSLASPLLRQVFSSVKKALQAHEGSQSLFQFVPEALVACSTSSNPAAQIADLEAVCHSTYDRILLPVDRVMSRRFFEHGEPIRSYFQDPAYTLARPLYPTVTYVKRSKAPLDVIDAGTFLHVGYAFSECGKWISCACVDQRGEAHDLAVWLTQTQTPNVDGEETEVETFTNEEYAVRKIWDFACQFAKRANVAWRIVFSKLGSIANADLNAWMSFLAKAVPACNALPDVHVTLLSVEPAAPWTFLPSDVQPKTAAPTPVPTPVTSNTKLHPSLPPKPMVRLPSSSSSTKTPSLFLDVSSTTYAIFPKRNLPLPLSPTPPDLGLSLSFVPETSSSCSSPTAATPSPVPEHASPLSSVFGAYNTPEYPHPLPLRPLSTTLLVRVPAASIASTPSMLHINLLAAFPQDGAVDIGRLHADITQSYHELAVLCAARWKLGQMGADPILPFHLAAVDAMRAALERDGASL
ncbi:mediator complex subunit 13 C-terminal-domain-containing protein [Mycena vitilis]|nr:mediator complex subunit 13 C-terminal-domain-containing protein [Mycena vitilis]